MASGSNSDYNNLVAQRNRLQQQVNDAKRSNQSIDQKIARLEEADRKMASQKQAYGAVKGREKSYVNQDRRWKGNCCNYCKSLAEDLKKKDDNYYKELDRILDEIHSKLSELRGQKYGDGWFADLRRRIDRIGTQIENFFR